LNFNYHSIEFWLLAVYALATFIQLIYYWVVFSRFAFFKKIDKPIFKEPISIVICAKNEFHNLKKHLPKIIEQDYPEFEVVVVNDASDDETFFFLEDLSRDHNHFSVVNLNENLNFFKGKKFALSLGIKSAKYENLVLTDADCNPAGKYWLQNMANGFSNQKEVVLGYGKYSEHPGFVNKIIRFETVFTAIQYFSLALWGKPYMGVGRNLAYKKSLFYQNKGFISHYKVSSGDDDLFINKVANKKNTSIVIDAEGFTISEPKKTFAEWWHQKRRHLSTGRYYKFSHKFLLGGYMVSLIGVYGLLIILLIINFHPIIVASLFIIRLISQLLIFNFVFKRLLEKKLLLFSPAIELIITLIYPIIGLTNFVSKESKWK
jgi:cellulose synthase/poly-beta-1,6-N-acetylglucosamine synthase-like glycosyltransferase